MKPNYVAKKSILPTFSFLRIILFFLIVPLIMIIYDIIKLKKDVIEFYDDKIISKSGVFSKNETTTVFMGVYAVNIKQSFWKLMFNYGEVKVDAVGKWDINTTGIKNPKGLKEYLEKYTEKATSNTMKIVNG